MSNEELRTPRARILRLAKLREKLAAGELLVGSFAPVPSPSLVETLGYTGLPFLVFDMEHGPGGVEGVEDLMRAADVSGTLPFVRVPSGRPDLISRVLDCGAAGIILPLVEGAADLDIAIRAMRPPPRGRRGMAPNVRASGYGSLPLPDYLRWSNDATLLVPQVETVRAVENIDEIVGHGGADIIFIGQFDLSGSLGVPGDTSNPLVQDAMSLVINRARTAGIPLASTAADAAGVSRLKQRGISFVVLSGAIGVRAVQKTLAESLA